MGMTHEEAIKWLELQSSIPIQWDDYSEESAQIREEAERRIAEAFRMAINVLKTQEPIKPRLGIIHHKDGSESYFLHCPLDGAVIIDGDRYCSNCGREVQWE